MIEERFLPELRKIPGEAPGKESMEKFLKDNVRAYKFILENVNFLQEFMLKHIYTFEIPS